MESLNREERRLLGRLKAFENGRMTEDREVELLQDLINKNLEYSCGDKVYKFSQNFLRKGMCEKREVGV